MSKYETLVRILDQIRLEGIAAGYVSYKGDDVDSLNQARAKAYIHLFLKVKFGLLGFKERESFMTDGTDDGGVDGYYLDAEAKTISFLQSKFRTNEKNFEGKQIEMSEIVSMDIARITEGETTNESGARYNNKILALIRRIREIDDIGRELNRPSMTKTNNTATRTIASFVKTNWGTEVATSTMLEAANGYLRERELQAKNVTLAKELRRTKKRKERAPDRRGRPDVIATEDWDESS